MSKKLWFRMIEEIAKVFVLTLWYFMASLATDGFVGMYTIPVTLICVITGLLTSRELIDSVEEIITEDEKLTKMFYK